MAAIHHGKATGNSPGLASEAPTAEPHRVADVAPTNLPLVRIDPAADWGEPESDNQEVTAPEDRALGARLTNAADRQGAAVVEACAEPLVNADGDTYTPALGELASDLRAKFQKIQDGDLSDPEAMLFAQAHALHALFTHLTIQGLGERGMATKQMYFSVALKAQAQSRATLTALADIKQPRQPNFIGQQNVALNQQVNNSTSLAAPMGEIENRQIKVLETHDGKRMDTGTTDAASRVDTALEAMGEVERTQDGGRQGDG